MWKSKIPDRTKKLFAIGAFLLLFAAFAVRQLYGFNKNDEIFYISTVYRFFQGDAMLADEWNNVQLFAFITYPVFCLVRFFRHSNEGIVLIFRIAYLLFQAAISAYCFVRLKRFGQARFLPALYYFVTTPYNINNLSYNTLAFGFVLLTLVTLSGAEEWKAGHAFLCGLFTAGAVLANPYAVLLFVLYGVVCGCSALLQRGRGAGGSELLSIRSFVWMGCGAFVVFVFFAAFVLSRGTVSEILECLPYIVMDTERQVSFWWKLGRYFIRIRRYYPVMVYGSAALLLIWLADRGRRIPSWCYPALEAAMAIAHILFYGFFWEMVGINYMLVPLAFPGLLAYLTTKKRDRRLFWGWYVPGLIYTLLAHFATNTGILTVSASYMIPAAASMVLIWLSMREQEGKRVLRILVCLLFAVQLTACVWQRITYVWGDAGLTELTEQLTEGPLKGIHTTRENAELYEEVLLDLEELQLTEEDRFFVVGIAPWIYLDTDAECAAYSTWETLDTDPLIASYYELRPQKLPTVIYCYEYDDSILDTDFAGMFMDKGYELHVMRRGVALTDR